MGAYRLDGGGGGDFCIPGGKWHLCLNWPICWCRISLYSLVLVWALAPIIPYQSACTCHWSLSVTLQNLFKVTECVCACPVLAYLNKVPWMSNTLQNTLARTGPLKALSCYSAHHLPHNEFSSAVIPKLICSSMPTPSCMQNQILKCVTSFTVCMWTNYCLLLCVWLNQLPGSYMS